jgi:hypothetical protein
MLTSLAIAATFKFQLLLGPALVIVLIAALTIALRFPSCKKAVGGLLVIVGLGSALASTFLAFFWGFVIGLITLMIGFLLGFFHIIRANRHLFAQDGKEMHLKRLNTPRLKKGLYLIFAIVIVVCSFLISIRVTGISHEEWLENYSVLMFGDSANVILKGTVASFAYNYEVNTGYSYHIFPAYVTLYVTEIVWSNSSYRNWTINYENLNHKDLVVYYEKTVVLNLSVGQQVEVKGVYCVWLEDSMYSNRLVVSPIINGSYLNPL